MNTNEREQTRVDLGAALETVQQRRYELSSLSTSLPSGRLVLTQITLAICVVCLHLARSAA